MRQTVVVALGVLLVVVLAIGAGSAWIITARHTDADRALAAFTDRYRPPSGWAEQERSVNESSLFCFGGNCPQITVVFSGPGPLSRDELQATLTASRWSGVALEGNCTPIEGQQTEHSICQGNGTLEGHSVTLYQQWDPAAPASARIVLITAPRS